MLAAEVKSYTATEDCYAIVGLGQDQNAHVDGGIVLAAGGVVAMRDIVPLKRGQTITTTGRIMHVYGLKGKLFPFWG